MALVNPGHFNALAANAALGLGSAYVANHFNRAFGRLADRAVEEAGNYVAGGVRRLGRGITNFARSAASVPPRASAVGGSDTHLLRMAYRRRRTLLRRRRFSGRRRLRTARRSTSSIGALATRPAYRSQAGPVKRYVNRRRVQPRFITVPRSLAECKFTEAYFLHNTFSGDEFSGQVWAPTSMTHGTACPAVYHPFDIDINNSVTGRVRQQIRLLRIDFFVELFAQPYVQCTDFRLSLVWDGRPATPAPLMSDIFLQSSAYPTGINLLSDTNSYPKIDEYNRFRILFQQNTMVGRGASVGGDPVSYAANELTCSRFTKSLDLRGLTMVFKKDITSGAYADLVSGGLLFCMQGGAGTLFNDAVSCTIRTRLMYCDL